MNGILVLNDRDVRRLANTNLIHQHHHHSIMKPYVSDVMSVHWHKFKSWYNHKGLGHVDKAKDKAATTMQLH